jgi:hypothetical protein
MRRIFLWVFISVVVLTMCAFAQSAKFKKPEKFDVGAYESGDFKTQYWQEALVGGAAGARGNILEAHGEGFIFWGAKLTDVNCDFSLKTDTLGDFFTCTTVYTGGTLVLSAPGPWLNYGVAKASNITATNVSKTYVDNDSPSNPNGILKFELTFGAAFDSPDSNHSFDVTANWVGKPKLSTFKGVTIQSGDGFKAKISIK